MVIDDLARVFHLGEKLFTSSDHPNLYRVWDEYTVTHIFEFEPELSLVATRRKKVVGFALGYVIEKPRTAWNYGHLVWLGVDEACQRMNVGEKLLDRFRDILRSKGVRIILVDTQADNKSAIRFFKKNGFGSPTRHVYLMQNLDEPGKVT
ncbi:MAG: GNAT family N-acetyltransferase [Candidatus Omnitrophica bacterium]|nr:GNAT family N-acetyltransferase [Candidatus Omnitrophota bacterium]